MTYVTRSLAIATEGILTYGALTASAEPITGIVYEENISGEVS